MSPIWTPPGSGGSAAGALTKTPGTATDNLVEPTADGAIALAAKLRASQTGDAIEILDSAGNPLFQVLASGLVVPSAGTTKTFRDVSTSGGLTENDDVVLAHSSAGTGDLPTAILALSPSSYWGLDDVTTTIVDDAGAIDGTAAGTYTQGVTELVPGDGAAMSFVNGEVDFGDNYDLTGNVAFTLLFWVKFDVIDSVQRRIFSKEFTDGSGLQGWRVFSSATGPITCGRLSNGSIGSMTNVSAMSIDTLYMVCWSYSGTQSKLYLNGQLDRGPTTQNQNIHDSTTHLIMGRTPTATNGFKGTIDEPALWSGTQLADADVSNLWDISQGVAGAGPVTLDLPESPTPGKEIVVVLAGDSSGPVVVQRTGADTINGSASISWNGLYDSVRFRYVDSGIWIAGGEGLVA